MNKTACDIKEFVRQINNYDNNLFHFTKLDSAVKILSTGKLRFGKLEDMNDIAESSLTIYSDYLLEEDVEMELKKYKLISFTLDSIERRGYEIDALWGHYSEGGNGVCLVFDKDKLKKQLDASFGRKGFCRAVEYESGVTNAAIMEESDAKKRTVADLWIKKHLLFFTKSTDWEYEQEYRFLIKGTNNGDDFLPISDCIKAVIVCSPKMKGDKVKESIPYQVLKHIENHPPIFRYQHSLGNKELICYECAEPHRIDDMGEIDIEYKTF